MPPEPEPQPLVTVAAIVAGAGAAGAVQGLVKGVAPTLTPEIAGAVAGGLLYYFGDRVHPLVKAFGVGVLAGSLAPLIQKVIPAVGGAAVTQPTATATTPTGFSSSADLAARAYVLTKR